MIENGYVTQLESRVRVGALIGTVVTALALSGIITALAAAPLASLAQ